MNKKYAYALAAIIALALIMLFVFKPNGEKGNKYIELIPANSTIVNQTDIMALVKKSDIANSGLAKRLTNGDAISGVLKKYMEDPKKIGLDAREPVYIFANANDSTTGIAIKMLDDDDFYDFLTDLHKENGLIGEIVPGDNIKTAAIEGYGTVAFNEEAALVFISGKSVAGNTADQAYQLFNMKSEEQFAQTADYKRMKEAKGDARIFLSMDFALELPGFINVFSLPDSTETKNVRMLFAANFDDGEANITGEIYSNDPTTATHLKDQWKNIKHVNGDYLNLMDGKGFLFATGCIDGITLTEAMDRETQSNGDLKNLLKNKHEKELYAKIKNIVKEANGDAALAIGLTNDGESAIPLAIHLAAKMKGSSFLADGDYWIQQANRYCNFEFSDFDTDDEMPRPKVMSRIDKNTYSFSLMGINAKVGVDGGNLFYLTTKESAADMLKQPVNSFLAANKNHVTAGYGFAMIDLKTAQPFIEEIVGDDTPFSTAASVIESVTLNVDDINKGVLKLNMTDHKANALKQLVELYMKATK